MDEVAVMGQSCGGFLSVALGADPCVKTIGVFNSGVQKATPGAPPPPLPTSDDLPKLHGPVLLINGHEPDFMMAQSAATFDMINHVPAFYGARHNAGHTATVFHPGGGEFANVASNWLRWTFKGDKKAGAMFAGKNAASARIRTGTCDRKGSRNEIANRSRGSRRLRGSGRLLCRRFSDHVKAIPSKPTRSTENSGLLNAILRISYRPALNAASSAIPERWTGPDFTKIISSGF